MREYNVVETKLQLIESTSDPDPVYTEWAAGGSYLFRETLLLLDPARATLSERKRAAELRERHEIEDLPPRALGAPAGAKPRD